MDNLFYVYSYIDPRNNEIFYIGKGNKNRRFSHLNIALSFFKNCADLDNTIKNQKYIRIIDILKDNDSPIITILEDNLNESDAFDLEKKLILFYGRKDLDTGSLLNLTNGQDVNNPEFFSTSNKHRSEVKKMFYKSKRGEENKNYLSTLYKGKIVGTPEEWLGEERGKELRKIRSINARNNEKFMKQDLTGDKNPFYGKHHSDKTKKILSEKRTGLKLSEDTRKNISKGLVKRHAANQLKKVPEYKVVLPNGEIDYIYTDDKCNFAKKHGIASLSLNRIIAGEDVKFTGKNKNGFKITKINEQKN